MKTSIPLTAALSITLLVFGCEKHDEPTPAPVAQESVAPPPPPVPAPAAAAPADVDLAIARNAAELANKIEQAPADADKILGEAGSSREAFMEKLYAIAEDPLLSAEYARLYQPKQAG